MYHPGGTIRQALRSIERNEYVLPAIQREFVWSPDQICALFDSLMQGYPFGEFLFWQIDADTLKSISTMDSSSTTTNATIPTVPKRILCRADRLQQCSTVSNV